MIADNFIYCRPETGQEARTAYKKLSKENKKVFYYGGGSEIISMARAGSRIPDGVIDIKGIRDCTLIQADQEYLTIGGAVSLNQIKESKLFPFLSLVGGRIADHTNQCRITLGGNLCGTIRYKEALLPLLLTDAQAVLSGAHGLRTVPVSALFHKEWKFKKDEFIYQIKVEKEKLNLPYAHIKRTENEKVDYPLVTVCGIWENGRLRTAFSGICSFPFQSAEIDQVLNESGLEIKEKANRICGLLPEKPISDCHGSGEYRLFVLEGMLREISEGEAYGIL